MITLCMTTSVHPVDHRRHTLLPHILITINSTIYYLVSDSSGRFVAWLFTISHYTCPDLTLPEDQTAVDAQSIEANHCQAIFYDSREARGCAWNSIPDLKFAFCGSFRK